MLRRAGPRASPAGERSRRDAQYPQPAQAYEGYFSEGGPPSVRHLGKGSRIRDKMNAEERAVIARERG